jgi:hypothetical protein
MKIAVFGDSHSVFNFAAYREVEIYWLGPVTMHRVGRDGLRSLLTYRGGFLPWNRNKLQNYDLVFASFGEIDCRAHIDVIAAKTGQSLENITADLARRYVDALCIYFADNIKNLCVMGVPPVASLATYTGQVAAQVALRRALNVELKRVCKGAGIAFIDYWQDAPQTNGIINDGWHDGNQHFDPSKTQFLGKALADITGHPLTFSLLTTNHFSRTKGEQTLLGKARRLWRRLRGVSGWK